MPTYVSTKGILNPAKEKVALHNYSDKPMKHPNTNEMIDPGEPYIYEGADRAALLELYEAGVDHFGIDFRKSPEFQQMLRDLNFKTADEYLVWVGYDEKADEEKLKQKSVKITKHEIEKSAKEIKRLGGGKDHATGKLNRYGGFGDAPNV